MRKIGGVTPGKRARRFLGGAAILVFGLTVCAPADFCRAEPAADNTSLSAGARERPAEHPMTAPSASEKIAAIQNLISRTIAAHENDIRDAYHRELVRNPAIEGEITVSFTVQPGGDVSDVQAAASSLNWPPLEEEILNRVRGWKFTPFEGRPVPATVPYKFTPR